MTMVSGVRCLSSSVSLVSSAASFAISGSSPGGSPSPQKTPPATRRTDPPVSIVEMIMIAVIQARPCAPALASIQLLPRKVANGGRPARPRPARVKTTPVILQLTAAAVQIRLVDRAEPVQDGAGAQEQGAFDQRVADHVNGGAGQAERGEQGDAGQEQADVTDRGERQHPFDVPLAEAEQRSR